jgi:hypothetical protein
MVKKERKKRNLEAEENIRRMESMKSSQQESDRKIQQQHAEIEAIRMQEQKAQQERIKQQAQLAQEEKDEIQFRKNLLRMYCEIIYLTVVCHLRCKNTTFDAQISLFYKM